MNNFNNSKKNKAVSILKLKIEDLKNVKNVNQGEIWKCALEDSLNQHLGPESALSKQLNELKFTRTIHKSYERAIGSYKYEEFEEETKSDFINIVQQAIFHIQHNGLYKSPDFKNILGSFSNSELISGLVFTIGVIFAFGNFVAKIQRYSDMLEKEKQIEILNIQIIELKKEFIMIKKTSKTEKDSLQNIISEINNSLLKKK